MKNDGSRSLIHFVQIGATFSTNQSLFVFGLQNIHILTDNRHTCKSTTLGTTCFANIGKGVLKFPHWTTFPLRHHESRFGGQDAITVLDRGLGSICPSGTVFGRGEIDDV